MDELVTVGRARGLNFEVTWADASRATTAADVTRGSLRLGIPAPVWTGPESAGMSWTWVELLEWLAVAWPSLLHEQGMPFGLQPSRPSVITARVEERWEGLPEDRRQAEESAFETFEENHNLARGLQGIMLSPLWVVRFGHIGFLCSDRGVSQQPYSGILDALVAIGDAIATRLQRHPVDARARAAISFWQDRAAVSNDLGVALATGLDSKTLNQIAGTRSLSDAFRLSEGPFRSNELLAVARQASQFTSTSILAVMTHVTMAAKRSTPTLDELSARANAALEERPTLKPFEQGYSIAEWLRETLGAQPTAQANPLRTLKQCGVEVREIDLPTPGIDAFGCWGPNYGPTVFMNKRGGHNSTAGGYRATVAHEICHLLLDREGALPLAEVLGGSEAPGVEARARAFAAEFLLPRIQAGALMSRTGDPLKALRSLQQRFGVSAELVAWQARNSDAPLSEDVVEILRSRVSQPDRF